MSTDDSSTEAPDPAHHPLSRGVRITAAVIGGLSMGGGFVGTFVEGTNAGGVPLLVGVGAVFVYLSLSGQPITGFEALGAKIKLAGREIERIAQNPQTPVETKAEIADVVERADIPVSQAARRELRRAVRQRDAAAEYEDAATAAVVRLAEELNLMTTRAPGPMRAVATLYLSRENVPGFPVKVQYMNPLGSGPVQMTWSMPGGRGLLITNRPAELVPSASGLLPRGQTVLWRGGEDDEALREAMAQLFGPG